MSEQQTKCELCGEPMPPGEEMFKYHGYSGPCPKSPTPAAEDEADEGAASPEGSGDSWAPPLRRSVPLATPKQQTPNLMEALKQSLRNAKLGEPTPPATPQPETWTAVERAVERMAERKVQQYRIDGYPELADVVWGFWYDTVREVLRGQLVALSPPPDVERLTIEQIRDRVQTLPVTDMGGEDMVDLHDVLTLFPLFPSTPGEGQP